MSELIDITDKVEYVYLTIPKKYVCTYHILLSALSDLGKKIIDDCQTFCNNKYKKIINCWNLFQCAISCYNINETNKADFFINYINKQLELIYKQEFNDIFKGALPLKINEDGSLSAIVSCNNSNLKFEIDFDQMDLLQINEDTINYFLDDVDLIGEK